MRSPCLLALLILTPAGAVLRAHDATLPPQAIAFEAFAPQVKVRRDGEYLRVESNGLPAHNMMVGITAWQQQVPLPQPYTGANAWQIPLAPRPAQTPQTIKNHFLRGAIAIAANGIPIFNPQNNRGEVSAEIGELDEWGGHCGRADDYHYHAAPLHLQAVLGPKLPIAYALDGYAIYGLTEPDGAPPAGLDSYNGHTTPALGYHYHASKNYPYINGGFHGEVTERNGGIEPQPRAQPVRQDLPPLRGAKITAFNKSGDAYTLTYELNGEKRAVVYAIQSTGAVNFEFQNGREGTVQQTATPRGRGGDEGPRVAPGENRPRRPEGGPDGARPPRDGEKQGGPQRLPDPTDGPRLPWLQVHGAELDANGDGTITAEEFDGEAKRTFAGYDRNHDGRLTREEYAGPGGVRSPMGGMVKEHAAQIDADGDGIITEAEFLANVRRMFQRQDRNGDGQLTPDEWRDLPPQSSPGRSPARASRETPPAPPAPALAALEGERRPAGAGGPPPQGGPGRKGGAGEGLIKATMADTMKAEIYADNWFAMYINGRLAVVDPIAFLPHNVVSVDLLPEYPMTIAIIAHDNADPKTGLEYGNHIGDAGLILKFADGTMTDATWKVKVLERGPIDRDIEHPRVETEPRPPHWFAVDFDDSKWAAATVYTEERVNPKQPYYEHDFKGAQFIWSGDLDLDNTVLFRKHIEKPGWKPRWTAQPAGPLPEP